MSRWFDGLRQRVRQLLAGLEPDPPALPGVEWVRTHAEPLATPGLSLFVAQSMRFPRTPDRLDLH